MSQNKPIHNSVTEVPYNCVISSMTDVNKEHFKENIHVMQRSHLKHNLNTTNPLSFIEQSSLDYISVVGLYM